MPERDLEEWMRPARRRVVAQPPASQEGAAQDPVNTTMPVSAPVPLQEMTPQTPPRASNDLAARKTLSYGGGPGQLHGFNTGGVGYDDKAANSVKNTFGRLAQQYGANTPSQLAALVSRPEFQQMFPGSHLVSGGQGDKVDFNGVLSDFESGSPVGVIDVGQSFDAANDTGAGSWWGYEPDGGGGSNAGGGGGVGGMNLQSILSGSDPLTDIIKRISDLQSGTTPDAEQQALLAMIRGERG